VIFTKTPAEVSFNSSELTVIRGIEDVVVVLVLPTTTQSQGDLGFFEGTTIDGQQVAIESLTN